MGAVRSGLSYLSWAGAALIVIALVLKVVWFDMASVGHNGMAPTLIHGERVLINRRGAPELGSIAVCQHPKELGWVVGRVVATAGMTIGSRGGELRVDGNPVPLDVRGSTEFHNADDGGDVSVGEAVRQRVKKTEVPDGQIYLLGDYRSYMGQDSRAYGTVDASACRGTIVFRLTSAEGLRPELAHGYFEPVR